LSFLPTVSVSPACALVGILASGLAPVSHPRDLLQLFLAAPLHAASLPWPWGSAKGGRKILGRYLAADLHLPRRRVSYFW